MTYKLITEPRLARAIKALESYDLAQIDEVLDILRAVQEREGPKLRLTRHHQASMATIEELYSLPEPPHD